MKGKKQGKHPRRNYDATKSTAGARSRPFANGRLTNASEPLVPVYKNEEVVLDIIGLTHDGQGVGKVRGFPLFVEGAWQGERVRSLVLKVKKHYGYAKMLERVIDSPHRVETEYPTHYYGGCQLQYITYAEQLRWKRQHVVDVLERIGTFSMKQLDDDQGQQLHSLTITQDDYASGREGGQFAAFIDVAGEHQTGGLDIQLSAKLVQVWPMIGMQNTWRYRNKSQMPIGRSERTGELIGGYFAQASHRIIDTDISLIQHEANDEAMRNLKRIARKYGIEPYNEQAHSGLLRHAIMRVGFRTNELMITLITNGEQIPYEANMVAELIEALPQLKSICQNINMKRTNVIMGDKTRVLWGSEYITDYIGDIKFKISARSFYQVNPLQTSILYDKVIEYAGLTGNETVIDAYCGIGTISLFLARHARRVLGVEMVAEAVADARRNAQLNEIHNVEFIVGAAEDVIPRWKKLGQKPHVIVADPPRKGCDRLLLDTMMEMCPERIVYVSCNPSTLARDLRILADGGYTVVEVQPIDMFPHTVHVETVTLLVRNTKGFKD